MTADPLLVVRIHDSLGSRTDGDGLFEVAASGSCDPCNFGSESCNVVFLLLQDLLRDKHGEISVLHAHFLDLSIKEACKLVMLRRATTCNCFPNAI
jgi:hypothetical protein